MTGSQTATVSLQPAPAARSLQDYAGHASCKPQAEVVMMSGMVKNMPDNMVKNTHKGEMPSARNLQACHEACIMSPAASCAHELEALV